jgi:cardiolipin synthase
MYRKEIFSIPNIMGYFRIALIPVFMYLYFKAETRQDYYIVTAVVGVSSVTDFLDGAVARKFNMVTELGMLIDPLADKLTQGALAICFLGRYPLMWLVLGLYVVKEAFMVIVGLVMIKHNGHRLHGAIFPGKLSTATIYVVMFLFLVFPYMSMAVVNTLIIICAVTLVIAFVAYIPVFTKMHKLPPVEDRVDL